MINSTWTKILLLGKNGQVGWELQRTLAPLGRIIALDHTDMDLSKPDQIRQKVREIKPELIVNAAAYTAVDKAEKETEMAMAINAIAPGILAEEAKRIGAAMAHYSTDYVFDGEKNSPYDEKDIPNPINVYGKSKLAGEQAVQAVGIPQLIFRTSGVYGLRGNNFFLTMMRLAKEKDELRVVDDQIISPTWCRIVAGVTALALSQGYDSVKEKGGIYHLTAGGQTSWYGFAQKIIEGSYQEKNCKITPITTSEYSTPAKRPAFSVLSTCRLEKKFGILIPEWQESLSQAMITGLTNTIV